MRPQKYRTLLLIFCRLTILFLFLLLRILSWQATGDVREERLCMMGSFVRQDITEFREQFLKRNAMTPGFLVQMDTLATASLASKHMRWMLSSLPTTFC